MIEFRTHNEALMWSRFERMFFICIAAAIAAFVDIVMGSEAYILTAFATIAAQFLVLKCWMDMILMSQPHLNCWAFKE